MSMKLQNPIRCVNFNSLAFPSSFDHKKEEEEEAFIEDTKIETELFSTRNPHYLMSEMDKYVRYANEKLKGLQLMFLMRDIIVR